MGAQGWLCMEPDLCQIPVTLPGPFPRDKIASRFFIAGDNLRPFSLMCKLSRGGDSQAAAFETTDYLFSFPPHPALASFRFWAGWRQTHPGRAHFRGPLCLPVGLKLLSFVLAVHPCLWYINIVYLSGPN